MGEKGQENDDQGRYRRDRHLTSTSRLLDSDMMPSDDANPEHSLVDVIESHGNATLAGSAFNLANTIIGAGMLSLPFAFSKVGYAGGIMLLLMTVLFADYAIRMLIQTAQHVGVRSYESLAEAAFGRTGIWLVACCVLIINIGASTAYLIILGDVLIPLIDKVDPHFLGESWARLWCTGVVALFPLTPLVLMRRFEDLAFASYVSIACIAFFVIVTLFVSLSGRMQGTDSGLPQAKPFVQSLDIFRAFSLLAFAFTCHSNAFPIYQELGQPSIGRMMKAVHAAMSICFVLYALVGLSGYIGFAQNVNGIDGDFIKTLRTAQDEWIPTAVEIAYGLSIMCTFPISFPPMRHAFKALAKMDAHPNDWSRPVHFGFSLAIVILCVIIATYVPVLSFVFSLTGATAGVTVVYVLPGTMMVKLMKYDLTQTERIVAWTIAIVGGLLGICSTVEIAMHPDE